MSNIKLSDFKGFSIEIDYKGIIDEYAEKSQKLLGLYSPKRSHRRNNNYASTWAIKPSSKTKNNKKYGAVVWNEKNYRLTHLLENGHLIVNKKGGVGWASANPHIDRVFRLVEQPFINAMERARVDITDKWWKELIYGKNNPRK